MSPAIIEGIDSLRRYGYAWDNLSGPMPALVGAMHNQDPIALQYLVYHVALRVLPCWHSYCDHVRPRETITMVKKYLSGEVDVNILKSYIDPTPSCVDDCRYSDTQSASNSIALCAAYMLDGEPLTAASCIEGAKCAFEHIFTKDGFVTWLLDVAVPISFEKRFMTEQELSAFAADEFTRTIYHDLFNPPPVLITENKIVNTPEAITRQPKSWWKFW